MGWVDAVRVQVGRALVCLAGVVLALGLRPVPLVAWLAAVAVNVLVASALLAPRVARAARTDPITAALGAAAVTAAATFAPALAPVAADPAERLVLAGLVGAAAYVGWRLRLSGVLGGALDDVDGDRAEP
jgi:hypothetical protein